MPEMRHTDSSERPSRLPLSIAGRLRATRGVGLYALLVAGMPILVLSSALGAATVLRAGQPGLRVSSVSGPIKYLDKRWTDAKLDDEIVSINGVPVEGDPGRIRVELVQLKPGPATFVLRRGERQWPVTVDAPPPTAEFEVF